MHHTLFRSGRSPSLRQGPARRPTNALCVTTAAAALGAVLLAGCGSSRPASAAVSSTQSALVARVAAIQAQVTAWQAATTLAAAQAAAENARNLVVGPDGPGYGDTDHNGTIAGATTVGLLPGLKGQPGLASMGTVSRCVTQEVLGGSWADPAARWQAATSAVATWTPTHNTFPSLQSQAQRIYGWASLTLTSTDFGAAHGYAADAQLHIAATIKAVEHC